MLLLCLPHQALPWPPRDTPSAAPPPNILSQRAHSAMTISPPMMWMSWPSLLLSLSLEREVILTAMQLALPGDETAIAYPERQPALAPSALMRNHYIKKHFKLLRNEVNSKIRTYLNPNMPWRKARGQRDTCLPADPSLDSSHERFSLAMDDGRDLMKAGM